jgi:hypothetical protein
MIEDELARPMARVQVEINRQQPADDGSWLVRTPRPSIWAKDTSGRFSDLIDDRICRDLPQESSLLQPAQMHEYPPVRFCQAESFRLLHGAVASELDKRVEKFIRAHI